MLPAFFGTRNGRISVACFLFFLSFFVSSSAEAHPHQTTGEPEHIERFDVDIEVNDDSSLLLKESIRYNFGPLEKHGIYRDIPIYFFDTYGERQSLHLSIDKVTDLFGQPYKYDISRENGIMRIKIGDPKKTIGGVHTYVITYNIRGALGFFEAFDELYWNVTGNDWLVPIERVTLDFSLPQAIPWSEWRAACYFGQRGNPQSCGNRESLNPERQENELVQKISLDFERVFAPGEGVTIAFGFPKGVVREPKWYEDLMLFIRENPFIFLPLIVFVFMFTLWWKRGRDPKGRGLIVPEYDVPEHLSPLEIAGLMRGKVTGKDIPAAIIDLAIKGFIRIEKTVEDRLLIDKTDYIIHKTERVPAPESIEEHLLDALFRAGFKPIPLTKTKLIFRTPVRTILSQLMQKQSLNDLPWPKYDEKSISLSSLKNKFYSRIPKLQEVTLATLKRTKLYAVTSLDVTIQYSFWPAIFYLCTIPLGLIFGHWNEGSGVIIFASYGVSLLIYIIFATWMPRVTREGAMVKERLLGLKTYLQIAEKNRLEFHNAPEKNPELFEKLLPAAMILGVSDIWAKEFADLLTTPPEWYSGPSGTTFSSTVFASDLGSFSHAASSTLTSSPGGSGGSGGGGSSGGGGGGGGGGSW